MQIDENDGEFLKLEGGTISGSPHWSVAPPQQNLMRFPLINIYII